MRLFWKFVKEYCDIRGWPMVEENEWDFIKAWTLWRSAAIDHGVFARALDGTASSSEALETGNHFQRLAEKGTSAAKEEGAGSSTKVIAAKKKTASAASQKDTEMDQELVLYEFVEVIASLIACCCPL